jgi:hypothetical protein
MHIIIEFSKKWAGTSRNRGMRNELPAKVSSEPKWQFGRRCMHETSTIIKSK